MAMAMPTGRLTLSFIRTLRTASNPLRTSSSRSVSRKSLTSPSACRSFSSTIAWNLNLRDMSESDLNNIKIDQDRLMNELHHTCQWGTGQRWGDHPTETGMKRLALSDSDKSVRDWFASTVQELGCTLTVDSMGNMFAVRPGLREGPPTYAGSHLDTQPSGGRYDGILGVLSAVEMLKVLNDNWIETEFPVGVVNWTNEEGARFPISMVSSGVWAGQIPLDHAHSLKEVGGGTGTQKSELERIGYLGSTPASHKDIPMAAHFELHIEQGPILETENRKIGIVKGVQAYKWYTIEIHGRDTHTGTTPFERRADALLAASKMILYSHRAATKVGKGARASTGILTLEPGSTNTVPGYVKFSLDIRAPATETVEAVEAMIREAYPSIASGKDIDGLNKDFSEGLPCSVDIKVDSISPAINFHKDCISCVAQSSKGLFGEAQAEGLTKEMVSGAGHDSVNTSYICPTSMIFIPCRDGVSHNPREYSTPEDCGIGAQVLMQSVLRYDRLRANKETQMS